MFKIKDTMWLGLVPGIVMPIITGLAYYAYMFGRATFDEFYEVAIHPYLLTPVLSLGCVINLAFFFWFIRLNKYKASRGVILSTILYAGLVVYFKLG